jgi:hypothetical protein
LFLHLNDRHCQVAEVELAPGLGDVIAGFPKALSGLFGEICQPGHCCALNHDKPPGFEFAVVGCASGSREQGQQFCACGRRCDQRFGGAGAARQKELQGGVIALCHM